MRTPLLASNVFRVAAILLTGATIVCAQPAPVQNFEKVQIQVVPVQRNIYMLSGAGGNITVQIGTEGVLIVDTEFAPLVPKILIEIRKLSQGHIRYIINTHVHGDHVGGNEALAKSIPISNQEPLNIIAHANVLNRLTATGTAKPNGETLEAGLPYDEYETPNKSLHFNGEAVVIYHEPKAHTDGDSIVLFRGSDVISTGDILSPEGYPRIDLASGGTVQGELAALNHLLELTVPGNQQEGGTYLIPGHGRICDDADLVEYRDMVAIITDRVQDLVKKGRTLEQVKAAKPTEDYDTQYGTQPGASNRFVEAVYRSLGGK
jgi:glyoxylase-like metal-dependent hydrolase (beta-lactamase superfamily II)